MKNASTIATLLVASLVTLVACGNGGEPGGATAGASGGEGGSGGDGSGLSDLSCAVSAVQTCSQYDHLPQDVVDALSNQCSSQHGTLGTACPAEDRLGCCDLSQGGIDVSVCYYSGGFLTLDTAQSQCGQVGGTWSYPDSGGSGGSGSGGSGGAKSYLFPTDVGNSWTFTWSGAAGAGNQDIVFGTTVTLPTYSSGGETFAWSLVTETTFQTTAMFYDDNAYARDGDDILAAHHEAGAPEVSSYYTIHYDPITGSSAGTTGSATATWMPHEDVVTPAGEFTDCYVLLRVDPLTQLNTWNYFKRGVGPVKATIFNQGEEFVHYELVSYHVK